MPTFAATKAGYHNLWAKCQIASNKQDEVSAVCKRIVANKTIYQLVEKQTKVPWFLVAALHYRESNLNFSTYLGNGDPLTHPTTHVPAGRGPFTSWLGGAVDALKYDKLAGVTAWSIELALYCAEAFNGEGYELHHDENSPYVWAGTNLQQRGKYTSDGGFDPGAWDEQLGVAAVLKGLCKLDNTVATFCAVPPQVQQPQPKEPDVTTTPTSSFNLDFNQIEKQLEGALTAVNGFAFLLPPQLRGILAFAPVLEGGLTLIGDLQHADWSHGGIAPLLSANLRKMADAIDASAPKSGP